MQSPPLAPQAVGSVPPAQVPESQHPVLQVWLAEHAVVQAWARTSQAWPTGQSVATLHPQTPAATHAVPDAFAEQSTHPVPVAPQATCRLPGEQTVPLQQPPAQGELPEHVAPQRPVVVSQASPFGQSPGEAQPQVPPARQAAPVLPSTRHEMHAPPPSPHWVDVLPATHVPAPQQPPLQS